MSTSKVHEVRNSSAQGDVIFRRVQQIPAEAVEVKDTPVVVAHSETGHHHVVEGAVRHFEMPSNPLLGFVAIPAGKTVDVVHQRAWDTHGTLRLLADPSTEGETIFEIKRQRELTPAGWARVQD